MKSKKLGALLLTVVVGIATAIVLVGLAGVSSALAQAQTGSFTVQRQPPPPDDSDLQFIAFFTDEEDVSITDLAGNILGVGLHGGEVRCYHTARCNQTTLLYFTIPMTTTEYEYRSATLQVIDPEEQRAIVAGRGTLSNDGRKVKFSYTTTIQDNRDGTIMVRYEASIPGASFIIPNAPGWLRIKPTTR